MLAELQPIFVKAVGKTECILWHKIGACLMITALNWHPVKDSRADFSQHRGSNHLVLLSSDHSWWFQGAKLIVCCVQSISIQREVTLLTDLKRAVQPSSLAREGTVSLQWQFRASHFKYILFFQNASKTWLVASVDGVYLFITARLLMTPAADGFEMGPLHLRNKKQC